MKQILRNIILILTISILSSCGETVMTTGTSNNLSVDNYTKVKQFQISGNYTDTLRTTTRFMYTPIGTYMILYYDYRNVIVNYTLDSLQIEYYKRQLK